MIATIKKHMPKDPDHIVSPPRGRDHRIDALVGFLDQRLDMLVEKSIEIAKSNGYAPFTTTIRAAWVQAILSVTESLGKYIRSSVDTPHGPLATLDYAADPRFARMRLIARQHRSNGITLQMYVGLFKHFRNLYLSELARLPGGISAEETARVRDFFDETELSIAADWNAKGDNQRLRELQDRTRAITLDKDLYFAVFESLQNPAFLLDRVQNLVNANQASAELFLGRDAQAGDIIYLRSMRLRKSSLQNVINQIMEAAQSSEQPIWLETLEGLRCFDVRTRGLHDAVENTALGHVVLLNDVTAHHRRAEEAQQSEQGMSRFLATMSHEIRTPLHSVLGAAELLRTADHANGETYLDVIEGAGKALLQTLSNVLHYSKFENEAPLPRPISIDLNEEIRTFERNAVVGGNTLKSRLSFDIAKDVPKSVYIDWGMTQQILSNLVSNSLRADNGDGVVVSVQRVEASDNAYVLRFEVRDQGTGIPETAAAAFFRPFAQTTARDTAGGGSGLGLAIARHLTDAMGGQIGYDNLESGTVVWFEIPFKPCRLRESRVLHKSDPSELAMNGVNSCLLVDDDPIGVIVTARQLERLSLSVTRAASVKEAKQQAAEATFDIFIVDYLLPDGDGPGLVKDLKRHGNGRAKFLALTANVEALAGCTNDFDEVLAKPVGQVHLSAAIFGSGSRVLPSEESMRAGFDGLWGLSPKTVTAMINTFSSSWEDFRAQMQTESPAFSKHDLALMSHRLAGSCAIMGIVELEAGLRRLESQCLSETDTINLADFVPELDRDLADLASWRRLNTAWPTE
ncbi:MAG: ATP-binding protein [Paracoccaceae bacterium]|nr:ATP-binding protein [Paracoccaceae bacterium]